MHKRHQQLSAAARLLQQQRWAALATIDPQGNPCASMVAYVVEGEAEALLLHISSLAAHTGQLLHSGRGSMVISEPDSGRGDPQQLARLSLQCHVEAVGRDAPDYTDLRKSYLQRLPDAAPRFDFSDFCLLRLHPEACRFVGGFGQARDLSPQALQEGWQTIKLPG